MSINKYYSLAYQFVPQKVESNLSASFKNSGRNQKYQFAARYHAPINDLDYTKPILQFSPKKKNDKNKPTSKQSQKNPQAVNKIKISFPNKNSAQHITNNKAPHIDGIKYHQYLIKNKAQQIPVILQSKKSQIELKNLSSRQNSGLFTQTMSTLKNNDFGLSQCQLKKTISGNIARKNSYNIQFQKMTDRPQNVNKIWYDKNKSFSPIDRQTNRDKLFKTRSFTNSLGHRVFIVKEVFEKNYDPTLTLTRRRSDINIRNFQTVKPRPSLQVKVTTNLDYQKSRSLQNKKRPLFQLFQIQRHFNFTKQIISPTKGAFR